MKKLLSDLLDFFSSRIFGNDLYDTGLRDDPRPEEKKKEDYLHDERLISEMPLPPGTYSNEKIIESPYPYENQWYVGSCVPHGVGLAFGIEHKADANFYVRVAQLFAYRLRSNYPKPGAWLVDIFNIFRKYGAPIYPSLPTNPRMTEAQATAIVLSAEMYREAEIYRGGEFYSLETPNDIDELAKIAQLGHAVPILLYATDAEWSREFPVILNPALDSLKAPIRHCVCILPKSGWAHYGANGETTWYVTVQDSAWFGGFKLRHLSEEFIKARVFGAAYWDTVQILGDGPRPVHTFTKVLQFGANSEEVRMMQKLLISEGLLPTDCATGYFGGRSLAAVKAFQSKYASDVLIPLGLDEPTGIWGAFSIAKANSLCKKV